MESIDVSKLITVKNVMELFGVTRQSVYNWRQYRGLPYIAFQYDDNRQSIRFDCDDVIKWADETNRDYYISVAKKLGVQTSVVRQYGKRKRIRKRAIH